MTIKDTTPRAPHIPRPYGPIEYVSGVWTDERGRWWDCSHGDHKACPTQREWAVHGGCSCHRRRGNPIATAAAIFVGWLIVVALLIAVYHVATQDLAPPLRDVQHIIEGR